MSNNKKRFPLFHVPHDGTSFPEELMESVCIHKEQFLFYHERMRDTGVLEMVPTAWRNSGNTLYFPVSRLLCDVERFPGPEEPMERLGMGFCYERAYDGTRIKTVSAELRRETLVWYHGHHEKLNRCALSIRACCCWICTASMISCPGNGCAAERGRPTSVWGSTRNTRPRGSPPSRSSVFGQRGSLRHGTILIPAVWFPMPSWAKKSAATAHRSCLSGTSVSIVMSAASRTPGQWRDQTNGKSDRRAVIDSE